MNTDRITAKIIEALQRDAGMGTDEAKQALSDLGRQFYEETQAFYGELEKEHGPLSEREQKIASAAHMIGMRDALDAQEEMGAIGD